MIEQIINGILAAISEEFGEEYTLYTESVKQGMKEPCFFVLCISPGTKLFRGRRYYHENQFAIQFLTDAEEPRTECAAVAERLFSCLELITVDGNLMRGTDMNAEIPDDVLTFTVSYNYFSYVANTEATMEVFEGTETEVKG
ncbi:MULTISPECIES: DUF6838 family protein [Clostridia]|uniref:phage tail terminator family protein n=1 Tax=Clostridia TaxID=186801 RepID=UPI00191C3AE3|nr:MULTISPECIES: hypothetical protein [Clostridia]